jgi:antitoxin (DNA-binding transcriptional repressor) of toxin-antitoxin stability system
MHEAKTRLSQLVAEVEAGREVVITRRGRPVARLVRIVEDPAGGLGSMRNVGTVHDLPWGEIDAGDRAVAELFGLGE